MLITFEPAESVGLFDVESRFLGVPQQPRAGTVTYRLYFLASLRCIHKIPQQKGVQWCQKGVLSEISRGDGVYIASRKQV